MDGNQKSYVMSNKKCFFFNNAVQNGAINPDDLHNTAFMPNFVTRFGFNTDVSVPEAWDQLERICLRSEESMLKERSSKKTTPQFHVIGYPLEEGPDSDWELLYQVPDAQLGSLFSGIGDAVEENRKIDDFISFRVLSPYGSVHVFYTWNGLERANDERSVFCFSTDGL